MKKRRKNPSGIRLIVRLCCFFVFVSSLHTQATVWAQGKVTVELQNKTLGEVLKVLKEQTGVHFMYNTQEVNVGYNRSFRGYLIITIRSRTIF